MVTLSPAYVDAAVKAGPPGRAAAWCDVVQMATGVALIVFMCAHMILVSSVLLGPGVMNALARFFEDTGMAQIGGPIIGLLFFLHFLLAARKLPFRFEQQRLIWKQARMMRHPDTWLWLVQAASAMIILILGAVHIWVVLTDLPITAEKNAARIQQWPWLMFYLTLQPLVALHLGIGLYRVGVKWGFIVRDTRRKAKKIAWSITLVFIGVGMITLLRLLTLGVAGG